MNLGSAPIVGTQNEEDRSTIDWYQIVFSLTFFSFLIYFIRLMKQLKANYYTTTSLALLVSALVLRTILLISNFIYYLIEGRDIKHSSFASKKPYFFATLFT